MWVFRGNEIVTKYLRVYFAVEPRHRDAIEEMVSRFFVPLDDVRDVCHVDEYPTQQMTEQALMLSQTNSTLSATVSIRRIDSSGTFARRSSGQIYLRRIYPQFYPQVSQILAHQRATG